MENIRPNNFIRRLEDLKMQYKDNCIVRENGTILLGPEKIPNCRHMLFKPLEYELIDEFLIKAYKNHLPDEYVGLLQYSNGAELYNVRLKTKKYSFAGGILTIYGLPRTQPYGRDSDMEEPFDVRIEDLRRNDNIPNLWLKCGTYTKNYDFRNRCAIFIDTASNKVYGCVEASGEMVDSWQSLDECLCSIMDSAFDVKPEYLF